MIKLASSATKLSLVKETLYVGAPAVICLNNHAYITINTDSI